MDSPLIPDAEQYPRLIAPVVLEALADMPVVCVAGPRQSGKTTLVRELDPERAYFSLDDEKHYRSATSDMEGFMEALPDPVTLDEVQRVPALFSAIKLSVDRDRRPGRFLLTGSANPLLVPQVSESLAGRMEIVQLQPLTEAEKEYQEGCFLHDFLSGHIKPCLGSRSKFSGLDLAKRIVVGGYPEALGRGSRLARKWHRQYLRSIIERDVREVSQARKGHELARLLEILALRNAQVFNVSNLAREIGLRRETVEHYVAVLERVFLVRRVLAWHRNTGKRLIKSPKIHLIDSGLAAALARLETEDWLDDRSSMGHLLESFVVQQIIAQSAWTDPELRVWHYRDKEHVEVDAVVTRGRKTWGIEVKAATSLSSEDGRGLMRLAEQCGQDFECGIVLYNGQDILPMGDRRMLAVPLNELWER